jgi:hypothetical protein
MESDGLRVRVELLLAVYHYILIKNYTVKQEVYKVLCGFSLVRSGCPVRNETIIQSSRSCRRFALSP